jgi:GNAT superfamily N-acetyltransferase
VIRAACPSDAPALAAILNAWIDATPWMPRVHSPEAVLRFYETQILPSRRVRVAGDPPRGFLALDEADGCVTALYLSPEARGRGLGGTLLDDAKAGRRALHLWTFEKNAGARRFYAREGFAETDRTPGRNEEGLPDIRLAWRA